MVPSGTGRRFGESGGVVVPGGTGRRFGKSGGVVVPFGTGRRFGESGGVWVPCGTGRRFGESGGVWVFKTHGNSFEKLLECLKHIYDFVKVETLCSLLCTFVPLGTFMHMHRFVM